MRLILRLLGTWLLGMALILLIIDGTRSLGASTLVLTALGETWTAINAQSLAAVRDFVSTRFLGPLLDPAIDVLLRLPGFLVLAVPGVLLAIMGRSRKSRILLRQDSI